MIYMRNLISKVSQRRLNLIDMLSSAVYPISFSKLTEKLQTTDRILRADISELNKKYGDHLHISISSDKVSMVADLNFGFDNIFNDILNENLSFQILENVFFESKSIERMAMNNFTSTSTLYRKAMQINEFLINSYNVKLNTTPFKITGDEKNIRKFYGHFFSLKYTFFEWPFDKYINEKSLASFINAFVREFPIIIDFAYFRNLKFIVAVNIIRLKKGYTNKISHNNHLDDTIIEILKKNDNFSKFGREINLSFDLSVIKDIFHDYIDNHVSFSSDELSMKAKNDISISNSYFQLLNIIKQLARKYDLDVPDQEVFITNLHNTVSLGPNEVPSTFFIQDRVKDFSYSVKEMFPEFHNDIEALFSDYLFDVLSTKDDIVLETMLFNVYTSWKNLYTQLMDKKNKVNIVVLSNSDHLHAYMLADIIRFEVTNRANLSVVTDTFIDEHVLNQYDIVISNFPLELNLTSLQIYVNNLPDSHNLINISTEVNRIFKLKN